MKTIIQGCGDLHPILRLNCSWPIVTPCSMLNLCDLVTLRGSRIVHTTQSLAATDNTMPVFLAHNPTLKDRRRMLTRWIFPPLHKVLGQAVSILQTLQPSNLPCINSTRS